MAKSAVAREAVSALRREIARIEGVLPERLSARDDDEEIVRRHGAAVTTSLLETGAEGLDRALDGGLPQGALIEFHGAATRDAGAVCGFALGLAARLERQVESGHPLLWIGTTEIFREAGFPYAPGLAARFALAPEDLLFCQVPKLVDALWVAEEAVRSRGFRLVVIEARGNPAQLDLTATRRLHRRAQEGERPVFLLREGARPEPTAAPVRLCIEAAPGGLRHTLSGPLAGSIGPPAFLVTIGKSRTSLPGQFVLEWNHAECQFTERDGARPSLAGRPEDPGRVVSVSGDRPHLAPAAGALMAFPPHAARAADHQPSREQFAAHPGARRTG